MLGTRCEGLPTGWYVDDRERGYAVVLDSCGEAEWWSAIAGRASGFELPQLALV